MSVGVGLPQIQPEELSGTNTGGLHSPQFVRLAHSNALVNRADLSFLMALFLLCTMKIEHLLRNEAERAAEDNPLARIMEWKRGDGHKLTVTTTTEHLAQRLGGALEKAFGGNTHYDFSHENKLARVNWQREY